MKESCNEKLDYEVNFSGSSPKVQTFLSISRHSENEARLTAEKAELAKQLSSCQKDLHDINEFLLNELKASLLLPVQNRFLQLWT